MNTTTTKIIDGEEYRFGLFPAGQSIDELVELLDILGISFPDLFGAIDTSKISESKSLLDFDTKNIVWGELGKAMSSLLSRMRERQVSQMIKRYMNHVIHVKAAGNEKAVGQLDRVFDQHFQGRLLHMMKVFMAAVEVQYRDFFDAIGGVQGLIAKAVTKLGTPTSEDLSGSSSGQ